MFRAAGVLGVCMGWTDVYSTTDDKLDECCGGVNAD